ncbi:MAG TPA: universal stress protein [Xanthobacteraceae bacterium]|jgi:nucleotide-binding universal stress UspA family protein|nr:universal stress protein [Xanthobacteraceae bacterium]
MSRVKRKSFEPGHQRNFLVVIDDTPECDRAVYYASRRAARTNSNVVMLAVVAIGDSNQQWLGVGDLMRQEAHEEAEKLLDHFAARAKNLAGIEPERVVREGNKADEVLKVIDEDEDVAILVLASASGNEGPGPLVTSLAGSGSSTFPIPITIVPGSLSDEELDALA